MHTAQSMHKYNNNLIKRIRIQRDEKEEKNHHMNKRTKYPKTEPKRRMKNKTNNRTQAKREKEREAHGKRNDNSGTEKKKKNETSCLSKRERDRASLVHVLLKRVVIECDDDCWTQRHNWCGIEHMFCYWWNAENWRILSKIDKYHSIRFIANNRMV